RGVLLLVIWRTRRAALQLLAAENRSQGSPGFRNGIFEWNVILGLQDLTHIFPPPRRPDSSVATRGPERQAQRTCALQRVPWEKTSLEYLLSSAPRQVGMSRTA